MLQFEGARFRTVPLPRLIAESKLSSVFFRHGRSSKITEHCNDMNTLTFLAIIALPTGEADAFSGRGAGEVAERVVPRPAEV